MRLSFLTSLTASVLLWKSVAGEDTMDECMGLSGIVEVHSDPLLELTYKVTLDNPEEYYDETIAFPNGDITAQLVLHRGDGFVGMGMSENFPKMIPGEVVVGLPDDGNVLQYNLEQQDQSFVKPASAQTLTNTDCFQNSTHTVVIFTQRLVQDGRIPFDVKNPSGFIYAIGSNNALGYHEKRGDFTTNLRVCVPETGLLPLPTSPPPTSPPTRAPKSGKEPVELDDGTICVEGYIMDKYCIETTGYLLDRGASFPTLKNADVHSVHCLADVTRCIESGYEVLTVEKNSNGEFGRQATLDDYGNAAVLDLALETGDCTFCKPGGTIKNGFRATVIGTWDKSVVDDPPVLKVLEVFESEVGCDGPMPPPSTPSSTPPPPPTPSPTKVDNGQEDLTMGATDCVGLTSRVQIHPDPLLELSYKTLLDDPVDYEDATLPNGNLTVELVLHRGSGWVGMGMSKAYPNMIPGEVVVGLPDVGGVEQYDLSVRAPSGVNTASVQSLVDTDIVQNSTHTVLTFTQRLVQDDRLSIDVNKANDFIWAVGFGNTLGFHEVMGNFSLNLHICIPGKGVGDSDGPPIFPTLLPTGSTSPTDSPTVSSTSTPSVSPTAVSLSIDPTPSPHTIPSVVPTGTVSQTISPTVFPSVDPTIFHSVDPTVFLSVDPTPSPSAIPSVDPSVSQTIAPTVFPSVDPTIFPTIIPTSGKDPTLKGKLELYILSAAILSLLLG